MRRGAVSLLFALALLAPATAKADLRYRLAGKFDTDSYPHAPLSAPLSGIALGKSYAFSVTMKTAASDLQPVDPDVGIYTDVTAARMEDETGGALDGFVVTVYVLKSYVGFGNADPYDFLLVKGYRNAGGAFSGPGSFFVYLEARYPVGTFGSDALPTSVPPLEVGSRMVIGEVSGPNGFGYGLALYAGTVSALSIDSDADGVADASDNCKFVANAGQTDSDGDGQGDACEGADLDADGVPDALDDCKWVANPYQQDANGDGIGDACAGPDVDADGVPDAFDDCPLVANADQADTDGDLAGDACDVCPQDATSDVDGDGVCPTVDDCPSVYNPDQLDADADGQGDACDADDDADGILDSDELLAGSDPRDADTDDDGVPDGADACPAAVVDQGFEVPRDAIFAALVSGRVTHAQSFTVGRTGVLDRVEVPIARNDSYALGSEVHDLAFSIVRTTGGMPDAAQVLGSAMVAASAVPVSAGLFLPNAPVLAGPFGIPVTAGDALALVVSSPGTVDTPLGPYFWNGYDSDGYAGGKRLWRIWTEAWASDATDDMGFRVFVGDPALEGKAVDAHGCAIAQLCPCAAKWKEQGSYVNCVAKNAEAFLAAGLISEDDKDAVTSEAAKSTCGAKTK